VIEKIKPWIWVALLVIGIRGFVAEPFKIPSPSMVPTLLVGDYIFVKRFAYGLRVPFTKIWLLEFSEPRRGDVVVFTYPEDESLDFIFGG
jgi:signal peptidase I